MGKLLNDTPRQRMRDIQTELDPPGPVVVHPATKRAPARRQIDRRHSLQEREQGLEDLFTWHRSPNRQDERDRRSAGIASHLKYASWAIASISMSSCVSP